MTWVELVAAGGWTLAPLGACSVLSLAIGLHKGLEGLLHRLGDRSALELGPGLLRDGGMEALVRFTDRRASPLSRVVHDLAQGRLRGAPDLAQRGEVALAAELDRYRQGMALLAYVAEVAPLLGLLGTVLGMVDLFGALEGAGGQVTTADLAGGIWKALLTTAAGLLVAIPSMGLYRWLERRQERLELTLRAGVALVVAAEVE
jgi:biopolymer transport protein ExbB